MWPKNALLETGKLSPTLNLNQRLGRGRGWPVAAQGLGPRDVLSRPGGATGCQVGKEEAERGLGHPSGATHAPLRGPSGEAHAPDNWACACFPPRTAQGLTTGKIGFV